MYVATGVPAMTIREAANRMRGRSDGAPAVMEDGRLKGIVTVSDLVEVSTFDTQEKQEKRKR
jgi:CBS domain-containing protein